MASTIIKLFERYEAENLRIKKDCSGECDGDNATCQKCKIIGTHRFLREELTTYIGDLPSIENNTTDDIYSFLTGSYKRGSILPPPKDVDFFEVMKNRESQTPAEVLGLFRAALVDIYPEKEDTEEISVQTHSITVVIDENFSVDIIPAFEEDGSYIIPEVLEDGTERWVKSNPRLHEEFVRLVNSSDYMDGCFLPIIRVIKSWRKFQLKPLDLKVAAAV